MTFYNQVINRLTGIRDNTSGISNLANQSEILDDTFYLMEEAAHESYIWPPLSYRCRLYSTASTTDFGNWTQINSTGVNWSSLSWITRTDIGNGTCHMTSVLIEDLDSSDAIYSLEIGFGADKTSIARHRFINPSAGKAVSCQQIRTRALGIHANTTIYYRLGCENASKYCDVGFRYHYHS